MLSNIDSEGYSVSLLISNSKSMEVGICAESCWTLADEILDGIEIRGVVGEGDLGITLRFLR